MEKGARGPLGLRWNGQEARDARSSAPPRVVACATATRWLCSPVRSFNSIPEVQTIFVNTSRAQRVLEFKYRWPGGFSKVGRPPEDSAERLSALRVHEELIL
jgi:hypothetical protein